jgi:hypothetical protein
MSKRLVRLGFMGALAFLAMRYLAQLRSMSESIASIQDQLLPVVEEPQEDRQSLLWTSRFVQQLLLVQNKSGPGSHHFGTNRKRPQSTEIEGLDMRTFNCSVYKGILLITDLGSAEGVGTAFFNLLVDQLIYADMYELMPVILPNNRSAPCFDANVHNVNTTTILFSGGVGRANPIIGKGALECRLVWRGRKQNIAYPGPPLWETLSQGKLVSVTGNSLWSSYFEPFLPGQNACSNLLPTLNLEFYVERPSLHKCAPFGIRSWPFRGLPLALRPQSNETVSQWLHQMRLRASVVVHKYFRLLPHLRELVKQTNPSNRCLAVHYRGTDKSNGRRKTPLKRFEMYMKAWKGDVFLATDDATIVSAAKTWVEGEIYYQKQAVRSISAVPTFKLYANQTHRTNVESLIDIYAMSRCQYLLHGFSAMAEAVIYLGIPQPISINLDDDRVMSVEDFVLLVNSSVVP